ncbi:hypothetical protein CMK11_10150 [Candidatus Poribacteria bacterium]|nr:hypothetical protein [Candidatus Poribacteria bacterium]
MERLHRISWVGAVGLVAVTLAVTAIAQNPDYNRVAMRGEPAIDGDLTDRDWLAADWQEMDVYAGGAQPAGFEAFSAVLWDDDYLYTAIEVTDRDHAVPAAVVPNAPALWNGDSPQHRVDMEYDGLPGSAEDIEWGYALQDDRILTAVWSSATNIEFIDVAIVRDDANDMTYYEAAVLLITHETDEPLSDYINDNKDAEIGYSDMVNANDGDVRLGWLEWSSGIGAGKNAALFGTMTFDHTPQAVDPAGKAVTTWAALRAAL